MFKLYTSCITLSFYGNRLGSAVYDGEEFLVLLFERVMIVTTRMREGM